MDRKERLQPIEQGTNKLGDAPILYESSISPMQIWQGVLLFLPLIYAAIYVIGMFYHFGYLGEFQLNPYDFQLPTDLTLLRGFTSLAGILSLTNFKYAIFLFAAFVGLLVFLLYARQVREYFTKFFRRLKGLDKASKAIKDTLAEAPVTTQLLDKSTELYARIVTLAVPFLILFILAIVSLQDGIADAKKDKIDLSQPDNARTITTSSRLGDRPNLRIICNTTHCAYWNTTGTLILRHDQVDQTLILPPKEPKKS